MDLDPFGAALPRIARNLSPSPLPRNWTVLKLPVTASIAVTASTAPSGPLMGPCEVIVAAIFSDACHLHANPTLNVGF